MVGTSGGGFALMVEGFSLAGMCEAPVLCVLSMRAGPASGVPTYTEQADLKFALNAGHGEFLRIIASPGTMTEAYHIVHIRPTYFQEIVEAFVGLVSFNY